MSAYLQGTLVLSTRKSDLRIPEEGWVIGSSDTDSEQALKALVALEILKQGQKAADEAKKKDPNWVSKGFRNLVILVGAMAAIAATIAVIDHVAS